MTRLTVITKLTIAYQAAGLTRNQAIAAALTSIGEDGYAINHYTDHAPQARSIHAY